jgi:hypothetical protein
MTPLSEEAAIWFTIGLCAAAALICWLAYGKWATVQIAIMLAVSLGLTEYGWTPNGYLAGAIGLGVAFLFTAAVFHGRLALIGLRARYRFIRETNWFLSITGGLTALGLILVLVLPRPWTIVRGDWGQALLGLWLLSAFSWFLGLIHVYDPQTHSPYRTAPDPTAMRNASRGVGVVPRSAVSARRPESPNAFRLPHPSRADWAGIAAESGSVRAERVRRCTRSASPCRGSTLGSHFPGEAVSGLAANGFHGHRSEGAPLCARPLVALMPCQAPAPRDNNPA